MSNSFELETAACMSWDELFLTVNYVFIPKLTGTFPYVIKLCVHS